MAAALPPSNVAQLVATGTVIDWNLKRDGQRKVYASGPHKLIVFAARSPEGDGGGMLARVLIGSVETVDDQPGSVAVGLSGVVGFPDTAYARLAVARLDAGSPTYSVIMTSFSGGAHCCDDVQIATPTPMPAVTLPGASGWTVLHLGAFDGAQLGFGPQGARLPAGNDGTYGVSVPDDAFDYAYGCYACSFAPLRIYGLRKGLLVDRTADPAFRPLLEADMRKAEAGCRRGEEGVCPGYLADASRLGRWAEGWRVLKASIKGRPQWGFPDKLCDSVEVKTKCRPGQRAQPIPDYPTSVRLFLRWRGYPVPADG